MPYNERLSNYANVQLCIHLNFLQIFIYMYSWLKHLKSCFHVPCHAYTLLLNWIINTDDDAENESDNTAQWYLWLRREGRNQLMVSCIHFLKWRISSNTWCEKLKWQYSTTRMSEYDGEGRNQQAVHSITVCQEQMPRWSIAGITNTEWLVPFQWFNSSFSISWLVNHQWILPFSSKPQESLCCIITFVFCIIMCDDPSFQEQSGCMHDKEHENMISNVSAMNTYIKRFVRSLNVYIVEHLHTFKPLVIRHILCILISILIIHSSNIYNAWWVHSFPRPVEFFRFV